MVAAIFYAVLGLVLIVVRCILGVGSKKEIKDEERIRIIENRVDIDMPMTPNRTIKD